MKAIKIILAVVVGIFSMSCNSVVDQEKEGIFTPGNKTGVTRLAQRANYYAYVDSDGDGIVDVKVRSIPKDKFDEICSSTEPLVFDLLVKEIHNQTDESHYKGHKTFKDDERYDRLVKAYFTNTDTVATE